MPSNRQLLLPFLNDADLATRTSAATALEMAGVPRPQIEILRLRFSSEPGDRILAASQAVDLTRASADRYDPVPIFRALFTDPNLEVRRGALKALARLERIPPTGIALVEKVANDDPDADLQQEAQQLAARLKVAQKPALGKK